jgi:radical SAM superfamily enzyme YgiQ (UPF0313 family)
MENDVRSGAGGDPVGSRSLSIALICPRFEPSFFGLEYALPLLPGDKRSASFGGVLPLLAALTPSPHRVTLIDENVQEIDFDRLKQFDVIGVTGMIVQRQRMSEILERLQGSGPILCVGGPYVTVEEAFFAGKCDVLFIGEADTTWPRFLDDVARGRAIENRYQQAEATDMRTLPLPRYDLLATKRYLNATVQFSRGCPFLCEFCDIIVIFGRKPRLKRIDQMLAELDALLAHGMSSVFFVDDNFIGNKAAAKELLRALIAWQEARRYPMTFSTEASVNLGDDQELLDLMPRAGFRSVFIGIESPRPESLLETRKVQNVRGDSLEAKLERIRDAGLVIQGGFIVGFDNDDQRIFEEQFRFVQRTGIGAPFVSVLSPIPSTPLYDRLKREGRLRLDDELVWFEPKQMSRERLAAGCRDLNARLYAPEAFFERIFGGQLHSAAYRSRRAEAQRWRRMPLKSRLTTGIAAYVIGVRLLRAILRDRQLSTIGRAYLGAWQMNRALGPGRLRPIELLHLYARHWHCFRVSKQRKSNWGKSVRPLASATTGADQLAA